MENSFDQKKKKYWGIIGIAGGILVAAIAQNLLKKKPTIQDNLVFAASEWNKKMPIMVDSLTRIDAVMALPDKTIMYSYTILSSELAPADSNVYKESMRPQLLNMIKTNPNMKMLRDGEVNFFYQYKREDGVYLFSVIITPSQYK